MKVISKWKDYYDFLAGVYGVDETLILDRTEFHLTSKLDWDRRDYKVEVFYICGWEVQGMWMKGELLFGKEIEKYAKPERDYKGRKTRYYSWFRSEWDKKYIVDIPGSKSYVRVLKEPRRLTSPTINDKYACPILLGNIDEKGKSLDREGFKDIKKHPILRDYGIQKVFSAEEIWLNLSEWLGAQKDIKIPDNMSDKEKIVASGFDLKTSFRKM